MSTSPTVENAALRVKCPHCGVQGTIRWDRLAPNKRVHCQRCDQWFRVEAGSVAKAEAPDAAITVAVRGALSDWQQHLAPASGRLERRPAPSADGWRLPFGWRTGSALGVALVALLVTGLLSLRGGAASDVAEAPYQEPEKLEDRAAEFTAAWAGHCMPAMTRFTAPGKITRLVDWTSLARLAPDFVETEVGDVAAETIKVEPQSDPKRAVVTVGLRRRGANASPAKNAAGYTHREVWSLVDGKWFFVPEDTIKALQFLPQSVWR